jgi:hypothetical protein
LAEERVLLLVSLEGFRAFRDAGERKRACAEHSDFF